MVTAELTHRSPTQRKMRVLFWVDSVVINCIKPIAITGYPLKKSKSLQNNLKIIGLNELCSLFTQLLSVVTLVTNLTNLIY